MSHPCPVEHCPRPAPGDQTVCRACQAELARALDAVPEVVRELETNLAKQHTRTAGGGGDIEDDPAPAVLHIGPLPYDRRASEAMWVLRNALVGWVRALHVEPREGPVCSTCAHPSCRMLPYSRGPVDTCQGMAAWLSAGLQRLVRHPAAEEAHGEIVAAVRAAERVVDRPAEREFAGRCPECGEALYAKPGASVVQCRVDGCEAEPVEVEAQLDQMRDRIRDQLAHPTGASALLARLEIKAPESTIRRWAKDHRILAHGTDQRGRSLYRIGDILDVVTEMGRSLPA